jgi:hypothetical protein
MRPVNPTSPDCDRPTSRTKRLPKRAEGSRQQQRRPKKRLTSRPRRPRERQRNGRRASPQVRARMRTPAPRQSSPRASDGRRSIPPPIRPLRKIAACRKLRCNSPLMMLRQMPRRLHRESPRRQKLRRNSVAPAAPIDQLAAGDQVPATSKVVQIERFQASAPDTARVEAPPQTQTLAAASIVEDRQTKPDDKRAFGSSIAPTLAMLAGAISAALVGCWLFGFGSARGIKLGA